MIRKFDTGIASFCQKYNVSLARIALFIIYFWFGLLKVIEVSPTNSLVEALLQKNLPFITFAQFIFFFGLFEMMIGLCFLLPKLNKLALVLLIPHLVTTTLPLFLLPQITWQKVFMPTMEGQYIIKNLLIIVTAMIIARKNFTVLPKP